MIQILDGLVNNKKTNENYIKKGLKMRTDGLIILPNKFDFISKINTLTKGMIYHAERIGMTDGIKIIWSLDGKRINEDKKNARSVYKKINDGRYVIVSE
jgi:hypothetical protein